MTEGKLHEKIEDTAHTNLPELHNPWNDAAINLRDLKPILAEAAKDILRPVMEKTFDNTGKAYLLPNGIDVVIDTRNAERKLGLIVRSIFRWFGEA